MQSAIVAILVSSVLGTSICAQLPPPPAPPGNPLTAGKILLGKMLFWEEQLSSDDATACGTCHRPEAGGGDPRSTARHPGPDQVFGSGDDVFGSIGTVRADDDGDFVFAPLFGFRPQVTRRSSPTVLGAAHHPVLAWDGAADGGFVDPENGNVVLTSGGALERMSTTPLLDAGEMGHVGRTWDDVRTKLQWIRPLHLARNLPADLESARQQHPGYPQLFAWAFGDPTITATRIAFALASYQRSLQPDDTPWDRHHAGQAGALTAPQRAGLRLFEGRARCSVCHPAPLFSDSAFHNLGLRPAADDPGHAAIVPGATPGSFRTPSLRNAGLRRRLFHNGQGLALADPGEAADPHSATQVHWRGGGAFPALVDPRLCDLQQAGVTAAQMALVMEFVRDALTDDRAANRLPPFDHPDLRSMVEAPPRVFGPSVPGSSEPFLLDWVPTYPGNPTFRLGLVGGVDQSQALLVVGFQSHEPVLWQGNVPWSLVPAIWLWFVQSAQPGQPGIATWHIPLPSDPALATVPLYYQMFVEDPLATDGIAVSQGSEFFIR